MNISQEANGELNGIIHINLLETDYIDAVNKQLSEYRKTANVPGFRPGKIPMGMIRKKYGTSVLVDEINKAVSNALNNYIIENKVPVLGYPIPNMEKTTQLDFDNQKEFDFFFDIGLTPEFEVELGKDMEIPYYNIIIADDELDKTIEDIKVRFGTEDHPEATEDTDAMQGLLFKLDENGERAEGDEGKKSYIKVADIKDEENRKKYLGLKVADKVTLNLMEEVQDEAKVKSLLGLTEEENDGLNSTYDLVIEEVLRPKDAELGEELYKKVFPTQEITTEEDFRTSLVADMQKQTQRDTDQQFLANTISTLIEKLDITLPDAFLKRWLLDSNQGKISAEQIEEQYDSYARTFRWQLIEGKLQEKHGEQLIVQEEEIRGRIAAYFQSYQGGMEMTPQIEGIIDQILTNKEEKQRLHNEILDGKFIEFFKNTITTQPEEVTREKFYEIASQVK